MAESKVVIIAINHYDGYLGEQRSSGQQDQTARWYVAISGF